MNTTKILTEEISHLTVSSLPTRPTSPIALGGRGYSADELKGAFDKLPLFIIERFNSLIDDIKGIGQGSLTDEIPTKITESHKLSDMFRDVTNGNFSVYLKVLDKSLAVQIAEILERLTILEGEKNEQVKI